MVIKIERQPHSFYFWIDWKIFEGADLRQFKWHGLASIDFNTNRALFVLFPFNFPVRWARRLYSWYLLHRYNDNWLQLRMNRIRKEGYWEGFRDGQENIAGVIKLFSEPSKHNA